MDARVKGTDGEGPPSPASSHSQSLRQVQNLGCYVVSGLIISAFLPAVAHGGNYFLSLSQVITNNVSLGRVAVCWVTALGAPPPRGPFFFFLIYMASLRREGSPHCRSVGGRACASQTGRSGWLLLQASCIVQNLTEPPGPPVHPEDLQHSSRLVCATRR